MIIFTDLSDVLIKGVLGVKEIINKRYDTDIAMKFVERKNEVYGQFEELMRGCITEDRFWEAFLSEGSWPFGIEEMKSFLSYNFALEIPGTFDLYRSIVKYPYSFKDERPSRTRIDGKQPEFWLISDHIAERQEELELLHPDIFSLFKRCIWSYDEVAIKKDPGFFQRLIKKNGLNPEEILFIDDDTNNTAAACKAGIHSVWFRNCFQLRYLLSRRGFGFATNTDE